jgi:hypothetical protein
MPTERRGGTRFDCDTCAVEGRLEGRGYCTGPLTKASGGKVVDGTVVIPAHLISGTVTALKGVEFDRCPEGMAQQPWVTRLIEIYRKTLSPGVTLRDVVPNPTPALLEGHTLIHQEVQKRDAWAIEREVAKSKPKEPKKGGRR